jgi:hypothetical protein
MNKEILVEIEGEEMYFNFEVESPMLFKRGTLDQEQSDLVDEIGLLATKSFFGETVFVGRNSLEMAIYDPKKILEGMVDEPSEYPTFFKLLNSVELKVEIAKSARSESVAEYLIDADKAIEFIEYVSNNPVARAHIFLIVPSTENEAKLHRARDLILSAESKRAASAALKELDW